MSRCARSALMLMPIMLVVLTSMRVAADPVVPPFYHPYDSSLFSIGVVALFNFPLNLLAIWVALFVILRALGRSAGALDPQFRGLAAKAVTAVLVVTLLGALIDYGLVYSWDYFEGAYLVSLDPLLWAVAVVLIFISVLVSLVAIVGIRFLPSALASIAITAMSPLSWLFTLSVQANLFVGIAYLLLMTSCVAASAVAIELARRWHIAVFNPNGRSEAIQQGPSA
ncbi:MAG: hypothetical protein JW880_00250 [Candidatus Thermoplasmatota archaeon]|nr:hypothetical protein [Candidatus Thermoplasmatota archaeon]